MLSPALTRYIIDSENDFENIENNKKVCLNNKLNSFDYDKIQKDYNFLQKFLSLIESKIKLFFQCN